MWKGFEGFQICFESSVSFLLFERRKEDSLVISVTFLKVCFQSDVVTMVTLAW